MSSPPEQKKARTGPRDPPASPECAAFAFPAPGLVAPSHTSSSISFGGWPASAVARDPDAFNQAMTPNHIFYIEARLMDVNLTKIYDNTKLPTTVNNPEFIQWSSRFSGRPIAFNDDRLSPDDPHDLAYLKQPFLYLWRDFIFASAASESRSEMELRTAIDALIRQAFDSRCREYGDETAQVDYRTEQEMCLPAVPPGIAKAGAVVWSTIPSDFYSFFQGLPNTPVFSAESRRRHNLLATFVFEVKFHDEEAAVRQICFDLCSAQHQRRALGFENHQIYGALLVGSNLRLYSSKWTEKCVSIQPTNTVFNLWDFQNFLKLFVFLCQLADYIHNQVQEMGDELEKDKTGFKKRITDAVQDPWRPWTHSPGSRMGENSRRSGSVGGGMDDSAGEGIGEGDADADADADDIRDGDQELPYPPLKDIYVRSLQVSPKDVLSWAIQTTEASARSPTEAE